MENSKLHKHPTFFHKVSEKFTKKLFLKKVGFLTQCFFGLFSQPQKTLPTFFPKNGGLITVLMFYLKGQGKN